MRRRAENAQVRYSAAYPTGRERSAKSFTMGSGTPRQAWLNYHDERNMNHKQTEM